MIYCDSFGRFALLIMNYTQLISPNADQKLRTMDIRLCCRCWHMAELDPRFSTLSVVVEYPFFIAGHDMMQKTFPSQPLKQLFTHDKTPFNVSRFRLVRHLLSLLLNSNAFKRFETVVWSTPNNSASSACAWYKSSWSNAFSSSSSYFFDAPERSLSSTWKSNFWSV